MRKVLFILLTYIPLQSYGQIIADHTIIDKFDDIPEYYINEVKKILVGFYGESHAVAYYRGLELLESLDSKYACNVSSGESYTNMYLRVENPGWAGEDLIFTWYSYPIGSRPSGWEVTWYKDRIKEYNDHGHPLRATGFGWCSDMIGTNSESSTVDPIYGVHWYGRSVSGIDGNKVWGLDSDDYSLTGNRVNLTTYFGAFEELIDYCATYSPSTNMIFTTGPVNPDSGWSGENGYQGHLKHEAIRAYVRAESSRILFDYADILCYDNNGSFSTTSWSRHTFPVITSTNYGDASIGHIGEVGAIRLAKAMWWMFARIAGWDGSAPLGIDDNQNNIGYSKIIVTHDKIELQLDEYHSKWSAGLYDFQGMEIIKKTIGNDLLTFDISTLSSGMYFIVLSNGTEKLVEKVIKP